MQDTTEIDRAEFERKSEAMLQSLMRRLATVILLAMESRGMTAAELASKSGLAPGVVRKTLCAENPDLTIKDIAKLEVALDCHLLWSPIFKPSPLSEPRPEGVSEIASE